MPKIITIGEILVEIMAKNIGQEFTESGEFLGPYPSGAPAIFIDQIARMGVNCGIISKVGNDDFGLLNLERLKKDGVDTSQIIVTTEYTTGTAFVTYFPDGSRKFIFHFTNSAAGMLNPDDISNDYISSADYLHIMGCSLSASESMRQAILVAVRYAKQCGCKVSFDPNIRPELLNANGVRMMFEDIISQTDILLTGESELLSLTGCNSLGEAIQLIKPKIYIVVVKRGSKGATVYSENTVINIPAFEVEEIDPTGAGDIFDGAFIASLAEGKGLEQTALIANAAGALAVTQKGPMEGASYMVDINKLIYENLNLHFYQ